MAIYDFTKVEKGELNSSILSQNSQDAQKRASSELPPNEQVLAKAFSKDQIFSAIAARLFFLLLFIADIVWIGYTLAVVVFSVTGYSCTGGKIPYFKARLERAWISLRRSLVCAVSLMLALFSPAFGIMIACTYFLMYDKTGIEEVVPSSLQSQFKEFLPKE